MSDDDFTSEDAAKAVSVALMKDNQALKRERDGLLELCDINLEVAKVWEADVMRYRKAIKNALNEMDRVYLQRLSVQLAARILRDALKQP